jgi:hypothetical protein
MACGEAVAQQGSSCRLVPIEHGLEVVRPGAEKHIDLSQALGGHPVTLRGLPSMTARVGVPGYSGTHQGLHHPDLFKILDDAPPVNPPTGVRTTVSLIVSR